MTATPASNPSAPSAATAAPATAAPAPSGTVRPAGGRGSNAEDRGAVGEAALGGADRPAEPWAGGEDRGPRVRLSSGLLLADEPTGALDSDSGHEIVELLSRLHHGGQTIVLVTHDNDVAQAAQHLIYMRDGQMVEAPDRKPAGAVHEVP